LWIFLQNFESEVEGIGQNVKGVSYVPQIWTGRLLNTAKSVRSRYDSSAQNLFSKTNARVTT